MSSLTITQVLPAPNSVTVEETGSSTSVVVQQSFNNTTVVVNPLTVTNYYGGGGEVLAALTGVPTLSTDLGTFAPGAVISDNTTIYDALNELDSHVTNQDTTISTVQSDVAGNATNISNNATNISNNTSSITTNSGDISSNSGDIGVLQTDLTQEITDRTAADTTLQLQITANNVSISSNDSDIASNTTDISANTTAISALTTGSLTQALDPTELSLFFTDPGTYSSGTSLESVLRDVLIHYQTPSITSFVANGIPTGSIEHGATDTVTTATWSTVNPSNLDAGVTGSITYYDPVGTDGASYTGVAYTASPYTLNKDVTFLVTAGTAGAASTSLAQANTYYLRLSGLQNTQGTSLSASSDFFTVNYKTFVLTSPTQINASSVNSISGNQLLADCAAGTNGSTEEHNGLHPNSRRQTTLSYPDTANYWYLCMPQCHWEYANKITTNQGFVGFDITTTVVDCGAFVYTNAQGADVNMQLLRGPSIGQIGSGNYIKVEYDSGSSLNSAPPPVAGQPGPSSDLLLDTYTGAAAAYSVRKLDKDYTGNCMKVRRDSDDAEADIGFDGSGNLDTAAIATHCGSANGYVVTWYDQSGNSNNATQSTSGSQPQIYNGTAVITENGKAAVMFETGQGSPHMSVSSVTPRSQFAVVKTSNAEQNSGILQPDNPVLNYDKNGNMKVHQIAISIGASNPLDQKLISSIADGASSQHHVNDESSTTSVSTYYAGTRLGGRLTQSNRQCVPLQEYVVYTTVVSGSDYTGIRNNINTYFSIYT